MLKVFFLLFCLIAITQLASAAPHCSSLFQPAPYEVLPDQLRDYRNTEVSNLSILEVDILNKSALARVQNFIPPTSLNRATGIEMRDAKKLLSLVSEHSVIGEKSRERYSRKNAEIGYCFGRAAFVHLALLKMGLQKESILKAWLVGPIQTPGVKWDFHVATVVYVKKIGWTIIDSNQVEPIPLLDWLQNNQRMSADHKLRLYITEPNKFGIDAGKYSRVQMGLDLNRDTDWYRNYFVDMMKSISSHTPEQLGLRRLKPDKASKDNPLSIIRDFFSN